MPDITVEPAALRGAAGRIEPVAAAIAAVPARLRAAELTADHTAALNAGTAGPTTGPMTGPAIGPVIGSAIELAGGQAVDAPTRPGATGLLWRSHGTLLADQQAVLRALSDAFADDAAALRLAAQRYEETECRNTIRTR